MPERYSRRLAGLGVEYTGLDESKTKTSRVQEESSISAEVSETDLPMTPPEDDIDTGLPPSPDRKRSSEDSPVISPPTERTAPKRPLLPIESSIVVTYDRDIQVTSTDESAMIPARAPTLITTNPIVEVDGSPAWSDISNPSELLPMALRLLYAQAEQATAIHQDIQLRQSQLLAENTQLAQEHAALIDHVQRLEESRQTNLRLIASELHEQYKSSTLALRAELEAQYQLSYEAIQRDQQAANLRILDATATISDLNDQLRLAREHIDRQAATEANRIRTDQLHHDEVRSLHAALLRSQKECEELKTKATQMAAQLNDTMASDRQSWETEREALTTDLKNVSDELFECYGQLDEARVQLTKAQGDLAAAATLAADQSILPCPNRPTLRSQLTEERARHTQEVTDMMAENRALLDRLRLEADQKISIFQNELTQSRADDDATNKGLQARFKALQDKEVEVQATLEQVKQATAMSDASYERAVEEQSRLRSVQEQLQLEEQTIAEARAALTSDRARWLHQQT
ncbi:hypothetical protein AeMF1_016631 [Aphanomyces euteiches]|nr:hypothetical protein AeMF1_016631 [Aphanomyces euteiches]KAH9185095.1 hypothetical protein AeNC1_012925 [Aphanomyces euteiches]